MTDVAAAAVYIQTQSVVPNKPTSEFLNFSMGGSINFLLLRMLPVGSITHTMLTEAQFQAQLGSPSPATWILSDGRSVAGSLYSEVTSNTTVPDLRGVFVRGKDNGRGLNPDGDLALGSYQADQFQSHNHGFSDPGHVHTFNQTLGLLTGIYQTGSTLSAFDTTFSGSPLSINSVSTGITFVANGGNETRAKNYTINYMIRIN